MGKDEVHSKQCSEHSSNMDSSIFIARLEELEKGLWITDWALVLDNFSA